MRLGSFDRRSHLFFLRSFSGQPWLLFRPIVIFRKIKDPVLVDEFVAEIDSESFQRGQGPVVSGDAIWTEQHQQVGIFLGLPRDGSRLRVLPGKAAFNLVANGSARRSMQSEPIGMEDQIFSA